MKHRRAFTILAAVVLLAVFNLSLVFMHKGESSSSIGAGQGADTSSSATTKAGKKPSSSAPTDSVTTATPNAQAGIGGAASDTVTSATSRAAGATSGTTAADTTTTATPSAAAPEPSPGTPPTPPDTTTGPTPAPTPTPTPTTTPTTQPDTTTGPTPQPAPTPTPGTQPTTQPAGDDERETDTAGTVGLLQGTGIGVLAALSILPVAVVEKYLGSNPLFDSLVKMLRQAGQSRKDRLARRD